jgi:hypothetical protein
MRKNSNIICDSYLTLTAASSHYRDNWICDETLFRLLNAHYLHLKKAFNFTREGLNCALSAKAGLFTGPNEFGLFFAEFHTECPYSGEKRRVFYFFRQVNGKPPADPVSPLDITDELPKSNLLQRDCMRLGRGGGDPPLDGNTPERGGGDPPSYVNTLERGGGYPPLDGNTLVERTHSNQHNDLYRRYPLACKKGKANFDSLVAKCISRDLLMTDRIRKFSQQARSYMLTYSSLQFIHEDKGQEQVMTNNTFTHTKIENMKKILKSHHAALDFD